MDKFPQAIFIELIWKPWFRQKGENESWSRLSEGEYIDVVERAEASGEGVLEG